MVEGCFRLATACAHTGMWPGKGPGGNGPDDDEEGARWGWRSSLACPFPGSNQINNLTSCMWGWVESTCPGSSGDHARDWTQVLSSHVTGAVGSGLPWLWSQMYLSKPRSGRKPSHADSKKIGVGPPGQPSWASG